MMDLIKITSRGNHEVVQKTRDAITERLAMEEKFQNKPEKVYKTCEEALARLLESSDMLHGKNSVTEESARIILKRGLRPSNCGSGFVFTRDLRLVLRNLHGLSGDFLMEFARNIQCPHLLIKVNMLLTTNIEIFPTRLLEERPMMTQPWMTKLYRFTPPTLCTPMSQCKALTMFTSTVLSWLLLIF